jgi:large subunit ribosomal protein L18e
MLRTIRKEDPDLRAVLIQLRKAATAHEAPIWAAVAERLARPRHQSYAVNVSRLERVARPSETIVVPGKLLAAGTLRKPLTVAAYRFSAGAREKVLAAGGTALTLPELIHAQAAGKGVRVVG